MDNPMAEIEGGEVLLCYKDNTFCTAYEQCIHHPEECKRALTPEIIKEAEEWWGSVPAPICTWSGVPPCFKPKP